MKAVALGVGASALPVAWDPRMVLAQDGRSFEDLIPSDKKLDPAWVRSLFERGEADAYQGWDEQLKYIGMPVGGIGCGQLYLGGDGRLWLWDIFKCNYRREPDHGQRIDAFTLGGNYAHPVAFGEEYTKWNGAEVRQGFALRVTSNGRTSTHTLDHEGFPGVRFRGEYPVGKVTYQRDDMPIRAELEAFSPFIPLDARESGLPATVMRFTLTNTGDATVRVDLAGWLENATCPYVRDAKMGRRINRVVRDGDRVTLLGTIEPPAAQAVDKPREEIVFEDFEGDTWGEWAAEGDAFKGGPFAIKALADYQDVTGVTGKALVNSHNSRAYGDGGTDDIPGVDNLTGKLTSAEFKVERKYINLSVGGGNRPNDVYIEVLVAGKQVAKTTGHNSNAHRKVSLDVSAHEGKKARIRIVDNAQGGWGNIQADHIVFSDTPVVKSGIEQRHGYGSMALSLLDARGVKTRSRIDASDAGQAVETREHAGAGAQAARPLDKTLIGGLSAGVELAPGGSKTLTFAITWYFPDYNEVEAAPGFLSNLRGFANLRRHYAPRFKSAGEVAGYLANNQGKLIGGTLAWNRTWYDSTLPYWLLDRSFISMDCVATQMLHWFDSGRLYGWEGVDCCPGTCTHVWHYAQGLARIFPELERSFREVTDYGVAFNEGSGLIGYRAENSNSEATDGQAGTILRAYREHLISADDAMLRRLWPKIKKSIEFLMAKDPDENGLIEGAQPHTLDAAWHGPMGWISGLYLAALAAGEAMAQRVDDDAFAKRCRKLIDTGKHNIVKDLFDGEYFIHKPDPNVPGAIRSGKGCHIDQVLGQAWAMQVGLGRVMPEEETRLALESLWKYNFAPDAGQYAIDHVEIEQAVRWYAMPGESGLVMCTWPKGGAVEAIPGDRLRPAKNPEVWTGPGGYFNECMNGFEYQVAAHMVYEGAAGSGLVEKGLAITRAVHDRYAAEKRNPYNEIECSDHYARSMASYGVFLAVCGFEYDGPGHHIGFNPRLSPEQFRAPFTAAAGWGTYSQAIEDGRVTVVLDVQWGHVDLRTVRLAAPNGIAKDVKINGKSAGEVELRDDKTVLIRLPGDTPTRVGSGATLEVSYSL